ncbi:hypothetical protein [Salidesulfovibrio brasiliensis]|uniref:hypothetical protein n=1 Tax=Salidesulfovibrio brasiliensis TaxID=221711 RepID=UPI0006D10E31|nr:hypothetical protein [Salidesulfovibrio brasiliensis]
MRKFILAVMLMVGAMVLCGAAPSQAVMGPGECIRDCDGDKECIRECRKMFMDEDEVKETYKKEFRECFDGCYELRGKEKEECLEKCRDDYKVGRELPDK